MDYPEQYRHRGFQTLSGHNTTLPILELTVPMCCEKCEEKVKEALEEVDGVRSVICDQYNQRVTVTGFVDPLRALRRVKRVKKKSAFFNNSTYINGTSLPIVTANPNPNPMVVNGESRYVANPLMRANSSGFGRFPHEGQMSPMMQQRPMAMNPMMQQQGLRRVNSFGRNMNSPMNWQPEFVPVNMRGRERGREGDYYGQDNYGGIRRMPSFKNHRYHDAEYISMGNEYQPNMAESHYVPRQGMLRPQMSFSRMPVTNPDYMKHMESEYY